MAFPQDRLQHRLELAFGADPLADPGGWTWTDVTSSIHSQTVSLRRGRSDEASEVAPASLSLQLDNPHGDYTPDHPAGAHYPFVRQGVPARYSVRAGETHLSVSPVAGARAVTTTAPAVPADLDLRVEAALDRLPAQVLPGAASGTPWSQDWQTVMAQYAGPDQYAWLLAINGNGGLSLRWSETGAATFLTGQAVDAIPYVSGQRVAIRVTLDTDNGAGGWTMRGYYAPTLAGPWTLLGEDVGDAPTTVFASTAGIELGDVTGSSITPGTGRYYAAQVLDGIDGALLASPDFAAAEPGEIQVTDAQGNVWDIETGAEITDWHPLVLGSVDEWAPTWPYGDLSDPDDPEERPGEARVDITISGILRRLGQGQQALESTLRRRIPSFNPLAYWPLEDGEGATQAYSPIPGVQPMRADALDFGADSSLPGSEPLPAVTEDSRIHGFVPPPESAQMSWSCEFVMAINEPPANRSTVMRYIGTGRVKTWSLQLEATSGDARILGEDDDGTAVIDQTVGLGSDVTSDTWTRWQFFAEQDGGSVDYTMRWIRIGGTSGQVTGSYTGTLGRIRIAQSPSATYNDALAQAGMRLGHIAVFSPKNETAYNEADHGFTGEGALDRMRRLAEEERLPISVLGLNSGSPNMGPQRPATLLDLLRECEAADGGVLSERSDALGLQYRAAQVLYNQTPALVLDAAANEIDRPFTPVLDDQRLRNDITVSRDGGSSARVVDEESIAEHGSYDDGITVNVELDGQLEPIASWRLHRGTWPGMRYAAVTTALDVAPQTIDAWLDREPGDRIQVVGLPPQHPTGTVDLLVEGVTHTISPTRWSVEAATSPAGPWTVGEIGGDDPGDDVAPTHIDTDGSRLVAAVDADDTQVIVLAHEGPQWCTTAGPSITAAAGDLPFDITIGGEDMTVTDVQPLLWDDFERTVPSGWGNAPDAFGLAWQTSGGATSDRSVALGTGRVSLPDTSAIRFQFLPAFATDTEILTQVIVPALATGGSLRAGIVMRISGASYYQLRVAFQTSGSVGLDIVNSGSITDSVSAIGQQYTAGSTWWIRARVVGDTVYGRAWLDGTPEPGWKISDTITSGTVESGLVGVTAARAPSNTNPTPIFQFTEWQVIRPQLFTVTRAANSVALAHAAGDDVRLAHPIIVAL